MQRGLSAIAEHLVINNSHPFSYRVGVIASYCSNFGHFAFSSHSFGRLGTKYDVYLGIGKRVVDFLLVLIELFSLDVTVESLISHTKMILLRSAVTFWRCAAM